MCVFVCVCVCVCAERGPPLKWQCHSDFCRTQITSLIVGLEIGLKGAVPPASFLPGWHQDRAQFTGISVIIPPGGGGEEPVRGRDDSNQNTSQPAEIQFIQLTHTPCLSPALVSLRVTPKYASTVGHKTQYRYLC